MLIQWTAWIYQQIFCFSISRIINDLICRNFQSRWSRQKGQGDAKMDTLWAMSLYWLFYNNVFNNLFFILNKFKLKSFLDMRMYGKLLALLQIRLNSLFINGIQFIAEGIANIS